MIASRSLSPNRNRRHSIFSHSRSRKNLQGSASTLQLQHSLQLRPQPPPILLQQVRREILGMCQHQTSMLIQQINQHQMHIHQLQLRLADSERLLQQKSQQLRLLEQKSIGEIAGQSKQLIERTLAEELDRRMQTLAAKFEQLEQLFVQNVYGRNKNQKGLHDTGKAQQPVISVADLEQLQQQTDMKLQHIVEQNRQFQQQLKNACSNLHSQLAEAEEAMQKLYAGLKSVHHKTQRCSMGIKLAQEKQGDLQRTVAAARLANSQFSIPRETQQDEFRSFYEEAPPAKCAYQPPPPSIQRSVRIRPTKQPVSPFQAELGSRQLEPSGQTTIVYQRPARSDGVWQLEQRLRRAVIGKRIPTPIPVFLDEQCFIRKADGAYLFDMDGDIFKTSIPQFRRLCQLHLLTTHD